MMDREAVLNHWRLDERALLGRGAESEIYALGTEAILRLSLEPLSVQAVDRRRAFYESLSRDLVSFQIPRILEIQSIGGFTCSIETRLPGMPLLRVLRDVSGSRRKRLLDNYVDAATEIGRLLPSPTKFGEIVRDPALQCATWPEFVHRSAEAHLNEAQSKLIDLSITKAALARLDLLLSRRTPSIGLVHGDFHLENVITNETDEVSGVLDFGPLTLSGDTHIDLSCAVMNLTGVESILVADREVVANRAKKHGLDDETLELYKLYYAFRLIGTSRHGLFRWCVARLSEAAKNTD